MERKRRIFWGVLFLLSLGWTLFGLASAAEIADNVISDAAAVQGLDSLASDLGLANAGTLMLVTGLPLCLIFAFFIWRGNAKTSSGPTKRKTPNIRRQTLLITLLAFGFAFVLWNIDEVDRLITQQLQLGDETLDLEMLVYPLRLFVTFTHEAGHVLAALITGGQVQGFTVSPNGSGLAVTSGGNSALILPAGYLGAALFGSFLFFLGNRAPRQVRGLSIFIGLSMILLTVIYARPDQTGSLTAFSIGMGFGLAMVVIGWAASPPINLFALNTLAIMTALHAVFDLWMLVGNADAGRGGLRNDAAQFAEQFTPLFSASMIAFIWAAAAVAMLGIAIYLGLFQPLRQEISDAVKGESG